MESAMESQEPTTSLTVLSYNVNFAAARTAQRGISENSVLEAIAEADCDVVLLQETHQWWERLLDQDERFKSYLHRDFYDYGWEGAGGISVMSRSPITNSKVLHPEQQIDGSWFPIWVGEIENILVATVHLRPPISETGAAGLFTMEQTSIIRRLELEHLFQSPIVKKTPLPMIIAGDFNETDAYSALSMLRTDYGMRDGVAKVSGHTHWWPLASVWGTRRLVLRSRLDHVFYSRQLKCLSCRVLQGYEGNASDHLPVITELIHRDEVDNDDGDDDDRLPYWTASTVGFGFVIPGSIWCRE